FGQSPAGGVDWLIQHDDRIACRNRELDDARNRLELVLFQVLLDDDEGGGGAVADLAGIRGADDAALSEQLHGGNGFERSVITDALVRRVRSAFDREWDDLVRESTRLRRRCRAPVAFECEAIERLAVEAVFLRHQLGTFELAEGLDAVATPDPVADWADANASLLVQGDVGEHRRAGHALGARRDDDVLRARHHRLRRKLHRLLGTAALPVNGDGRNTIGQLRREHRVASESEGLLAG